MIIQSIEYFVKQGYNVKIDRCPQLLSNVVPVDKIRISAKHQTLICQLSVFSCPIGQSWNIFQQKQSD